MGVVGVVSESTRQVMKLKEKLSKRFSNLITRAVLSTIDEDGLQRIAAKALGDQSRTAELFQQYGITSKPLAGAEGILLNVNGHRVAICFDDASIRPDDLAPGESCLYNDKELRVHLKTDGTIELHGGGATDFVALATNLQSELADLQTWANTHVHSYLPGPGPAANTATAAPAKAAPPNVAASKVKAE